MDAIVAIMAISEKCKWILVITIVAIMAILKKKKLYESYWSQLLQLCHFWKLYSWLLVPDAHNCYNFGNSEKSISRSSDYVAPAAGRL